MKQARKVLANSIAAFMVVSLVLLLFVGCSKASQESATESVAATASTESVAATASEGSIELNLLWASGTQSAGAQIVIPEFEKWYLENYHQTVKVNMTDLGYSPLLDKLSTEALGKSSTYDVLQLDHPWVGQFVELGFIEPLDKYVNDPKVVSPDFDLKAYIPAILDQYGMYQDKLYALPFLADCMLLYYRADLFEKYNLKIPDTWEEYLEVAEKLTMDTNNDGNIDIYGDALMAKFGHQLIMMWEQRYLSMAGSRNLTGTMFDESGKPILDNPTAVAALQNFVDMLKFCPSATLTWEYPETIAALQQGTVAMCEQWTMIFGAVNDPAQSTVPGKIKCTLIPGKKMDDGSIFRTPHLGGWSAAVNAYSKNKIAAYKFIEYLTFFKAEELAFNDVTPTLTSIYSNKDLLAKYQHYPVILESLKVAVTRPRLPELTDLAQAANEEISNALSGQYSSEEAIKNMNNKWTEILKK
jgi:multiple sugar transport system substrate-binding protein